MDSENDSLPKLRQRQTELVLALAVEPSSKKLDEYSRELEQVVQRIKDVQA